MIEERISEHIKFRINPDGGIFGRRNLVAYNILIHIAYEMLAAGSSEEAVKRRIDKLTSDPIEMLDKEIQIRDAYGEYWGKVKDHVDRDTGWIATHLVPVNEVAKHFDVEKVKTKYGVKWRPKVLSNIDK